MLKRLTAAQARATAFLKLDPTQDTRFRDTHRSLTVKYKRVLDMYTSRRKALNVQLLLWTYRDEADNIRLWVEATLEGFPKAETPRDVDAARSATKTHNSLLVEIAEYATTIASFTKRGQTLLPPASSGASEINRINADITSAFTEIEALAHERYRLCTNKSRTQSLLCCIVLVAVNQ